MIPFMKVRTQQGDEGMVHQGRAERGTLGGAGWGAGRDAGGNSGDGRWLP